MHVQNKKYGNFVSISRLTGKCAAQKYITFVIIIYGHVYIIVVIIRSQNKITNFFMISTWLCSFNIFTRTEGNVVPKEAFLQSVLWNIKRLLKFF